MNTRRDVRGEETGKKRREGEGKALEERRIFRRKREGERRIDRNAGALDHVFVSGRNSFQVKKKGKKRRGRRWKSQRKGEPEKMNQSLGIYLTQARSVKKKRKKGG